MSSTSVVDRAVSGRTDPKLVCAITLALVFLAGAVIGALAFDLKVHNRARGLTFDTPEAKSLYFEHMQKELELTPAQAEQMQTVLNDFWQYYRTVLTDG